ncbi:MAG TPA: invasion associated locus B family protein [Reyranella sp.]|jgi:invasion protein IalB|nr:invasion associated locus B family protein [Reyranella sp.]
MSLTGKIVATTASGLLLAGHPVIAQSPPAPPAAKTSSAQVADQTTATFGDWTLRCDRRVDLTPPQRVCELGLVILKPGETGAQAQIAVGRVAPGRPLQITAVLPPNVALKTNPRVVIDGQQPSSTILTWSRCVAGACFADAELSPALMNAMRLRTDPARLDYRDGTDRDVSQSVSFRGVRPALEALAQEEAK